MKPKATSFTDDAKALATALINTEDGRDPYWPMAAQALVKGLLMALRVDNPGVSDSLGQLRTVLGMKPEELATFANTMVDDLGKKWPAIATSLGEFTSYHPEDREIGGIRRNAQAQTDWLDSQLIQEDLQRKNSMDFASFKETPQTCYLILPPSELVNHAVWLRLMVTAALRPLLQSDEGGPVPVLFMLDEVAALGHLDFLIKNIALLRSYGVKLWTVWQDINQMKQVYPKAWGTIMGTAEAKITFTSGDIETRDYFSQLSGERLYRHNMRSTATNISSQFSLAGQGNALRSTLHNLSNQGKSSNDSTSEQFQSERVIKPYEIAALDADEAVIFTRRGRIDRAICPQPDLLPGIGEAIQAARLDMKPAAQPST
jgi:type IV secretion system protein VirD4